MGDLDLITSYNDIALPTAWDIKDKSPFIEIDSSGLKPFNLLKPLLIKDPDDYKAAVVRANHPAPSVCGIFYFEIKIIDKGKNGMIGIGYCTKQSDKKKDDSNYINNMLMPGQENESWGCGYHGDDGYSFCSGSGTPYDKSFRGVFGYISGYIPGYTTGDIVGCYLNFRENIVFYTKNGINLGIACHLHSNFKGILYPCVGFRSQGGSVKANFGNEIFKYSGEYETMLVSLINDLTKSLEKEPNNTFELSYRGKLYFIMGKYNEAFEDLTRLLEIVPDNTIALRYRGEINYIMKRYNESIIDLVTLLRIKPNNEWAKKAYELVDRM
ncbi:concanavalin A-like lectin/glucanase domain-containing protein [Gigaspora rosea]|uniref:Concanavalin A-like lectin/glucanase domain-containing protein n=1 Tax=Gigaspora rosea TaxID=44941 RepID=A0A397UG66_9GLOM|nr:concanavalin A-like lectin/glucanase domain-containing protein [Gigaspora rosea]